MKEEKVSKKIPTITLIKYYQGCSHTFDLKNFRSHPFFLLLEIKKSYKVVGFEGLITESQDFN